MFQSEIKSRINEDISILVKKDNHPWNYLCECGDAQYLTVKEVQNCNAIFISHTHIDHFVNFDSVIRHQIGIQRRVVICGPKDIAKHVESKLKSYTWNLIQKGSIIYEIREVISENEIRIYEIEPPVWELIEIGNRTNNQIFEDQFFIVTAVLLDHKIPTMAYKFIEKDSINIDLSKSEFKGGKWVNDLKQAFVNNQPKELIKIDDRQLKAEDLFHFLNVNKGNTLGVIMDHAAHKENHSRIKAHFHACDKVLIESFYKEEDKELAEKNFHSYSRASAKIMKLTEVKEAIPVHFSRKYSLEDIEQLISEFKNV